MKLTFITGGAGTGKSYTFREMIEKETRNILKCAPTGVAATNIGGSTIYSTFAVDINTYEVNKEWPLIDAVYIDEISMVSHELLMAVIRGVPNAEEIIMFGDMAQLPPVKAKYWFDGNDLPPIKKIELTKQWRQKDDLKFAKALNAIRIGDATTKDLDFINKKSQMFDDGIVLAFQNRVVDAINSERVKELGEVIEFKAKYGGSMKPNDCIADETLQLAKGAKVIMLNNDIEHRWVNGTSATIEYVGIDEIKVLIGDAVYSVNMHQWQKHKPMRVTAEREEQILNVDIPKLKSTRPLSSARSKYIDKQIKTLEFAVKTGTEYVIVGSCEQYPVKLAYALTVHKSQGMTLDKVFIIPDGFNLNHGIGYVALSRARSIDTIALDKDLKPYHFKFDKRVEKWI